MSKKRRFAILVLVLAIVGAAIGYTFLRPEESPSGIVASGTIEATEADLGFQIAGRIETISVREGYRVEGGSELAGLDRTELEARKRVGQAQVAAARARLAELERGYRVEEIEQGRATLRVAEQRLGDARRDVERSRRLFEGGAVSRELLEKHETQFEVAKEEHARVLEQLQLLEAGPREERIAAQRAALAQAEAAITQIDATMDFAVIRAPFEGVITVRHREPGETVPAGAPVLTLMNPEDRWVRIYVREDEVGHIALGHPARITADADPARVYEGEVVFISSEAEFTPRNVQTTEERVKLVYRVKVQITGDPNYALKAGLAADVRLEKPGK
jgi:HlyD family secretion protein